MSDHRKVSGSRVTDSIEPRASKCGQVGSVISQHTEVSGMAPRKDLPGTDALRSAAKSGKR